MKLLEKNGFTLGLWACFVILGSQIHGFCQEPRITLEGHKGAVTSIRFSEDGRLLASVADGELRLWEAATGRLRTSLTRSVDFPKREIIGFLDDGRSLITVRYREAARVISISFSPANFEVRDDRAKAEIEKWTQGWLWYARCREIKKFEGISQNGEIFVQIGKEDDFTLLRCVDSVEKPVVKGTSKKIGVMEASKNGTRIACGGSDGEVSVWQSSKDDSNWTAHDQGEISCVVFSPKGDRLASGGKEVKLRDARTGKEIGCLAGFTSKVRCMAFSPDGNVLATGSAKREGWRHVAGEIKLWDLFSAKEISTLPKHGNIVGAVAFSPDGKTLATGSDDGSIILWNIPPRTVTEGLPSPPPSLR